MGADQSVAAEAVMSRPQASGGDAGNPQRDLLNGAQRCWLADASVEFGPWQTVYWWFRRFVRLLLFRTIHDVALMMDREQAGREASPSGGVLDSQTVKAPFADKRGFDGGTKIVGRKRHVAVDTDGTC